MKLRREGTGTVSVPGFGEVGHNETIEVSNERAQALLEEQPDQWSIATEKAAGTPGRARRG